MSQLKEQLITFDTAKLAKEKGFNWKVRDSYVQYVESEIRLTSTTTLYDVNHNVNVKQYAAPSQSLLKDWLLQNHNIFVTVTIAYEEFGRYASEVWGKNEHNRIKILLIDAMTVFDNPKEALEEGLQEALKLI